MAHRAHIELLERMISDIESRLSEATNEMADRKSDDKHAGKFAAACGVGGEVSGGREGSSTTDSEAPCDNVESEAKAEQHDKRESHEDIMDGHTCSDAVEDSIELVSGAGNDLSEEASAVEATDEATLLPKSPRPTKSEPIESAEEKCEENNTEDDGHDVTEENKRDQSTQPTDPESIELGSGEAKNDSDEGTTDVEDAEVITSLPPQPPKRPEETDAAEVGNANGDPRSDGVAATALAKPQTKMPTNPTNTLPSKPENLVSFETATSSYDEEALRRRKIGYGVNSKPGSFKNRLAAFEKKKDNEALPAPPKRKTGKLAVSSIFESGRGVTTVSPTSQSGRMGGSKLRDRMAAFENKSKATAPIGPAKSRPIGRVTSNPFVGKDSSSSSPAEETKQSAVKHEGLPSKVTDTDIPSNETEVTSVTDSLAASAEADRIRQLEDEKLSEKNRLEEKDRLEKERLAEEKAEQERRKREMQLAEEKERLLQEERQAAQLESYAELTIFDDDLNPSRELTEEETERLRAILNAKVESHPRFNLLTDGQDAQDLLDYCFDMICDMESVGHVVAEIEFMGFYCFNDEVSGRFRRSLTKFFSDMN